jgi:hypothetical protein
MKTPSDLDLAYVAGFVDGEGSINMGGGARQPHERLTITNTNLEVLQHIQTIIGGQIGGHDRPTKPHWKTQYYLCLTTRHAVRALRILEPFLVLKKKQAILMIRFSEEKPGLGQKWPEGQKEYWHGLIQAMNRRGKAP